MDEKKPRITDTRIAIWVLGGIVGLYLLVTGIIGALS